MHPALAPKLSSLATRKQRFQSSHKFSKLFQSPLRCVILLERRGKLRLPLSSRTDPIRQFTALRYQWGVTDASGNRHSHTISSDSYMVDVYRAVAEPGSRHLISPSSSVDEASIDRVHVGGGLISISITAKPWPWGETVKGSFAIRPHSIRRRRDRRSRYHSLWGGAAMSKASGGVRRPADSHGDRRR